MIPKRRGYQIEYQIQSYDGPVCSIQIDSYQMATIRTNGQNDTKMMLKEKESFCITKSGGF